MGEETKGGPPPEASGQTSGPLPQPTPVSRSARRARRSSGGDEAGNGKAVAALVLGIVGLLLGLVAYLWVIAIPALIISLGAVALGFEGRQVAAEREGHPRQGMADVAILLGGLGVVASVVGVAFSSLQGPVFLVVLLVVCVGLPIWAVVRRRRRKVGEAEQALADERPPDGWPLVFHDNLWQLLFRVRTDADRYGPGDTVSGTVTVAEGKALADPMKLLTRVRSLSVGLRYVDHSAAYRSPGVRRVEVAPTGVEGERSGRAGDYRNGTDHVTVVVHEGAIDPTVEYPFALQLPDRPLPAGSWGVVHLYWAVSVHVDRKVGVDVDEVHPISLVVPPGTTLRTGIEARRVGPTRGWDVAVTAPTAVVRGDDLEVAVELGDPTPDRADLRVGLECRAHYEEEGRTLVSAGEFETPTLEYKRKSASEVVHEQSVAVDGSSPNQLVALRIPADGPFSHAGRCAGLSWELVVREPGRRHGHHELRVPLTVLP